MNKATVILGWLMMNVGLYQLPVHPGWKLTAAGTTLWVVGLLIRVVVLLSELVERETTL